MAYFIKVKLLTSENEFYGIEFVHFILLIFFFSLMIQ